MPVYLRPDSNVTQTNVTGGFAQIDEVTPDDADYVYTNTVAPCVLEVGLSNPPGTPAAGTTTIRYRLARANPGNGALKGGTPAATATMRLYQGATLIATDTARSTTLSSFQQYSWVPDTSGISDWNDLRLRLNQTPADNNSGVALSWAEVEVPFGSSSGSLAATEAADSFSSTGTASTPATGTLAALEVADEFSTGPGESGLPYMGMPVVCMRCGFRVKASGLRKEWSGARVCAECYDPKPEDLRAPVIRPEGLPKKGANPEAPPEYVGINEHTRDQL